MAPEVRLSGPENEPLGVVSLMEALRMAGELDVDLVEIAATANPPVCRLMDYGKFKYQEQKRAAEAKAKQTVIEIKEVKFRPGTDDGDYNIKMRNIRRFWRMETSARSRCGSAVVKSRTRNWVWPCSIAFATSWLTPS
jgi:translation initiation factor IF-3